MSAQTIGLLVLILIIAAVYLYSGPGKGWLRKAWHKKNSDAGK
jgi:hypothetical protein